MDSNWDRNRQCSLLRSYPRLSAQKPQIARRLQRSVWSQLRGLAQTIAGHSRTRTEHHLASLIAFHWEQEPQGSLYMRAAPYRGWRRYPANLIRYQWSYTKKTLHHRTHFGTNSPEILVHSRFATNSAINKNVESCRNLKSQKRCKYSYLNGHNSHHSDSEALLLRDSNTLLPN